MKKIIIVLLLILAQNSFAFSTRNCSPHQEEMIQKAGQFIDRYADNIMNRFNELASEDVLEKTKRIEKFRRTIQGDMRIVCKESESRACRNKTARTWVFTKRIDICYNKIKIKFRDDHITRGFCALIGKLVHEAAHVARIPVNWRRHNISHEGNTDLITKIDSYAGNLCSFLPEYENLQL